MAIVTGGGSGIGRGLCKELARKGAFVVCADKVIEKAEQTVAIADEGRGKVTGYKLDVSIENEVKELIDKTVKKFGRLDFLFNNAGISIGGEIRDLEAEHWKKVLNVNFYGMLYGSQSAYNQMIKQGHGHIVNTASITGLIEGIVGSAPYDVSKHAIVTFTKILRLEAKAFGIKVSLVCPGIINTEIGMNLVNINASEELRELILKLLSKGMNPLNAAGIILRRVARNHRVIIFPFTAWLYVLFTRLFKSLNNRLAHLLLSKYRKDYRMK